MRIILTAAAVLLLAGCGGAPSPATPPAAPSTAGPTVKLDAYARQACAKLDSAAEKRSDGDTTGANLDEASASIDAAESLAPGLRDIALKYDSDGVHFLEAAPHLREWCYKNQP